MTPTTTNQPYPFQDEAIQWLHEHKSGLVGYPVGSGKTVIGLLATRSASHVLIITPPLVIRHWANLTREWLGEEAAVITGNRKQRMALLESTQARVVIINHEMLRDQEHYPRLWKRYWGAVVIDEAHKMQNRKSQQSMGARSLHTDRMILMTGTPIWNRPESFWHLLRLVDRFVFSSYWRFVNHYCEFEESFWGRKPMGIRPDRVELLRAAVAPYLIYRSKEDILPDLPPKVVQAVPYEMDTSQRRQYSSLRWHYKLQDTNGSLLRQHASAAAAGADLRRVLNGGYARTLDVGAKTATILDLLETLEGRKTIVFTWLKDYAGALYDIIYHKGYKAILVTGDTPHPDEQLDFFRGSDAEVLVTTIAKTGTGIDLIEASAAIFAEAAWSPALNVQAEGRLHRIGTKTSPIIYRLYAPGTIEERIWRLMETHADLTSELLAMQMVLGEEFQQAQA